MYCVFLFFLLILFILFNFVGKLLSGWVPYEIALNDIDAVPKLYYTSLLPFRISTVI